MRRYTISIALSLLVLSLVVPVTTLGIAKKEAVSPNMTYLTVVETDSQVYSVKTYIKDDQIYLEVEGQLYAADMFQETLLTTLEENMKEALEAVEIRELGEEIIDGYRTMHFQMFSKKTGLLEQESWQSLDLPLPLALKTVSYDPEGNVISTMEILDLEFDPDFSMLDFSLPLQLPLLEGRKAATPLTSEEFKEMVPWYDLSLRPLANYELTEISYVETSGALRFTLTYSNTEQQIQVMIHGVQDRLRETHGPSEFELLSYIRIGEFVLEPAMRSSRTGVMAGFLGSFDRSNGNIFLRKVILHPTLQQKEHSE